MPDSNRPEQDNTNRTIESLHHDNQRKAEPVMWPDIVSYPHLFLRNRKERKNRGIKRNRDGSSYFAKKICISTDFVVPLRGNLYRACGVPLRGRSEYKQQNTTNISIQDTV